MGWYRMHSFKYSILLDSQNTLGRKAQLVFLCVVTMCPPVSVKHQDNLHNALPYSINKAVMKFEREDSKEKRAIKKAKQVNIIPICSPAHSLEEEQNPCPHIWKLRFGEITDMPSITELVSNRTQNTSAPLKFCCFLQYSMLPSNNMKYGICIGKDANSQRNSIELQLEVSFQYEPLAINGCDFHLLNAQNFLNLSSSLVV